MKRSELFNLLLVAGLSFVAGLCSFFVFGKNVASDEAVWILSDGAAFDEKLNAEDTMTFIRDGRDSLTLFTGAEATVTWDEKKAELDVDLENGELVYATLAGDMDIYVNTPFARVDSQGGMAYVTLDAKDGELQVYAEEHPALMTFTLEGKDLNALAVPTGFRVKALASKVGPTLEKLRLSKLSKEFPAFEVEDSDYPDAVLTTFTELRKSYTEDSVKTLSAFNRSQDLGPSTSGFASILNQGANLFRDLLTVAPHADQALDLNRSEQALHYAISNALDGNTEARDRWILEWKKGPHDLEQNQNLWTSLFFVLPGDSLYEIKTESASILYGTEDLMTRLRRRYQEVESLLDRASHVQAQEAYIAYKTEFELALNQGTFEDPAMLDELSREYILIELLLRQNEIFYNVKYTDFLSELESSILTVAGSSQDFDEEKLAFVQSRIRFLENLFTFVVDRKVSVEDATDLGNELLFEAEDYLNTISTDVAVTAYFRSKLEEFDLSLDFINSPEFRSYDSFDEGLADYKLKAQDLEALNAYLQTLRSGDEIVATGTTAEAATEEAKTTLKANSIQFSDVVSLGDSELRLFEIQGGQSAGHSFEGNFDRETEILYDVEVEGLRFSSGIKVDAFGEVITEALKVQEEGETNNETTTQEDSVLSSVALEFAKSKFEEAGLNLEDFEILVVDIDQNIFTFEGVVTASEIPVSGSLDADTELVTEGTWEYNGTTYVLDPLQLSDLESTIEAAL